MTTWLSRVIFIFVAAIVLSEATIASSTSSGATEKSWKFRVWLDDTPIGYHQVSVNNENNIKTVYTQANFDVRFLFVPVYSYSHETRELWENGCLVNIKSTTDDNGDGYFISSMQQEEELALQTQDGMSSLSGCVRTFAYWDIELLQSERLLNTQTGKYESVTVTDMGTGYLNLDEEQIEARRFKLVAADLTIDLWYTSDMRWLALESVTESGAVLRYLPEAYADYGKDTQS